MRSVDGNFYKVNDIFLVYVFFIYIYTKFLKFFCIFICLSQKIVVPLHWIGVIYIFTSV